MKRLFLFLALIALLVVVVNLLRIRPPSQPAASEASSPITYRIPSELDVTVNHDLRPFASLFDETELARRSQACGTNHSFASITSLLSRFTQAEAHVYRFRLNTPSQQPDTFTMTVLPNLPGYTSLDQFQNDFALCEGNGVLYPSGMSADWLQFTDSCGEESDDASGLPQGCAEVAKQLQLNLN